MGFRAVVLAAVVSLVAGAAPAMAAPPFSDPLCPRAVQFVIAFNDAATGNDALKIRDAARGAGAAYRTCASVAQATPNVALEPTVNYQKTRAAQFLVVEGRLDATAGDSKAALAALHDARSFASEVVEWQPQSMSYTMSNAAGNTAARNSDRNGSRYKDAAAAIVAAVDVELGKLGAASPQPTSSPKP